MARDSEYGQSELGDMDYEEQETSSRRGFRFSNVLWMMAGVACGIATMYLLDPRSGSRRRVLLQGRVRDLGQKLSHPMDFIKNKTEGLVEESSTHH